MNSKMEKCKQYYKKGILLKMIKRKSVNMTRPIWICIMRLFPINNTKICFDNFEGTGFGGDPKHICLELMKRNPNLKIIWFVRKKQENFLRNIKQVNIDSVAAIYHQSTAKVWVDNTRTGHRTKKRKGQYYLQTWHANVLAKKIEKDAEDKLWPSYIPVAKYDGLVTDAFIVANKRYLEVAKSSFWLNPNVEYLKIGAPANDVLFQRKNDQEYIYSIKQKLSINDNAYIVLYAPSFRDDGSIDGYKIDFERVKEAFRKTTNRTCIILVRFHPDVVQHEELFTYSNDLINVTRYPDLKDLSLISDCLITDYSSTAYDFLLLRKTIFRLCLDFNIYKDIRDVYDDFYKMPYALAYTNDELVSEIMNFNNVDYQKALNKYCEINPVYDDGTSSKKAADWIERKLTI